MPSQPEPPLPEERFRAIMDGLLEGCQVIGRDWRYLYINDAAERHNRRPKAELIGRRYMDMWPGIESTPAFAAIRLCLEEGTAQSVDNQFTFPDGTAGWFKLSIQPVPEGAFILSMDVTEAKSANEALRAARKAALDLTEDAVAARARAQAAREEWEHTFNAVPDLIAVLDARHRIRRVNKAMADRLGLSPGDCVGRACHETVHGSSHPFGACPHALTCSDGKEHFAEVHEDRLHGDFLVSTTPIFDEAGRVTGAVHVARDITEAKKAEAELREAAKLRTDLISLINHEYANGLTNMRLALALLRGTGRLDASASHAHEVMLRTLDKLKGYTENFLNLHRLESGTFDLSLQPTSIRSVLLDDLVTLTPLAEAKKQSLSLQTGFPEDLPVAVRADPDCLSLIINNLVTNAVKYTPEGGRIAIRVSVEKTVPPQVRFSIEDTGIGLSAEDRERVLSGPYRTEEGKQLAKGFGVGLVLVRQLLQKHGSRLVVESEPGRGSRFSFCLPVWADAPSPSPPSRMLS
ncbi:MAG: PAS domain-containing sensor histidine kinase [Elusimicrobia bacterium]|nr:PAS domain-containing sensor histidine kinase [Elusimicrobiota bacterium]